MPSTYPRLLTCQLLQPIAEGAYSTVYLARDLKGDSSAVKIFNEGPGGVSGGSASRLFLRELEVLSSVRHPNVVALLNFGHTLDSGQDFLEFEHFPGRDFVSASKELTTERFYDLLRQLLGALHHLHSKGVAHGDLKPDNILVDSRASTRSTVLKIVDLGLAGGAVDPFDRSPRGSPAYLAPEIIQGGAPSARSDLYSVGVLLYECIVGQPPFVGASVGEVLQKHLSQSPPEFGTTSLRDLHSLIRQLLRKNPDSRPASAREVLRLLDAVSPFPAVRGGSCEAPDPRSLQILGREGILNEWSTFFRGRIVGEGSLAPVPILLAGCPGAGKTRLAWELSRKAREQGCWVGMLQGAGLPTAADLPALAAEFLDTLKGNNAVLTVDCSDRMTSSLLDQLRDKISARGRVLLVVTIDSASLPSSWCGQQTGGRSAFGDVVLWRLEPLEPGRVADVAQQLVPSCALDAAASTSLARFTGGVPGILVETLATHAVDRPGSKPGSPATPVGPLAVTASLSRLLDRFIRHLDTREQTVIRFLSASPVPLRTAELAFLLEDQTKALEDLCLCLEWRGVLASIRDRGMRFWTVAATSLAAHALGLVPLEDRQRLFSKLAEFFSQPERGEEGIYHAATCMWETGNSEDVITLSLAAVKQAEVSGDYPRVTRFCENALSRMCPADPRRSEIVLSLATSHARMGRPGDAEKALVNLSRQADLEPRHRCRALLLLSSLSSDAGDLPLAVRLGREASNVAGSIRDWTLLARSLVAVGSAMALSGRSRAAVPSLIRASLMARRSNDASVTALALNEIAGAFWRAGTYARALTYANRSVRMHLRARQPEAAGSRRGNVGTLMSDLGRYGAAKQTHNACLNEARKHGWGTLEGQALNNLGHLYLSRGRWREAMLWVTDAITMTKRIGARSLQVAAEHSLASLLSRVGAPGEALGLQRHRLAAARRGRSDVDSLFWLSTWALLLYLLGRFKAASRLCRHAVRVAEDKGSLAAILEFRVYEALSLAACGSTAEALELIRRSIEEHGERSSFHTTVLARLAALEIALAHGTSAAALRPELENVIATTRRKHMGWQLAQALTLSGRAIVSADPEECDPVPPLLEAIKIARKIADRTIEWEAHYWLGRAHEKKLRYEQAVRCYRIAALTLNELALNIDEDRYRKSFLGQPKVLEVLGRYRRLKAEVGKRARHNLAALSRSERISRRMLDALNTIGQKLSAILDLDELLRSILDLSIENVRAERGLLFLRDAATGDMRIECARGIDGESLEEVTSYSTSVVRKVAEGRTLLTVDVGSDSSLAAFRSLVLHEIKSILCVPMRARGRVTGVIYLDTRKAAQLFTDKERAFVESFASQAAVAIENARLFGHVRSENARLKDRGAARERFATLVGGSPAMRRLWAALARILDNDSNVLIHGESGTGKEVVARALHDHGPRRRRKFVAVDCGALPEHLLEAELFGHARGAFTGADRDRIGLIQEADGGTLFLDEITNTSLALQARLLRVIQEKEVRRLGENLSRRVDVRVLAATNADIGALIGNGRFRRDLYYRLNVLSILVPPLRERLEDIPLLIDHFLRTRAARGRPVKAFEPEVLERLASHDWPGNVRELENLVERLLILAPGSTVRLDDMPAGFAGPGQGSETAAAPGDSRKTGEQVMLEDALRRFHGDKTKAARYIGWNRQKLYRRMRAYGIPSDYGQSERKAV